MGRPNFRLSRDRDLDLGSGHTAYRHVSLVDLYLRTNVIEIEETFCGRTDGRTFETHCIRSTRRSRPKNVGPCGCGICSPFYAGTHVGPVLVQAFVGPSGVTF